MKSGIELIAEERQEQIEKHGFTNEYQREHPEYYSKGELVDAACYAMYLHNMIWPTDWNDMYKQKIYNKSYKDRLIVAGALIAAEIDRLQNQ
jgi:hypothetical protein